MSGARYASAALHCVTFLFTKQTNSRHWNVPRWILEGETLYLAMNYAVFFLGKAAPAKDLFELLLGAEMIPKDRSGISSVIPTIEANARCRLNSRIHMTFSISQDTSNEDFLGVQNIVGMLDRIYLSKDQSIAQWEEETVQRVTTAMSGYVSMTCRSLLPEN